MKTKRYVYLLSMLIIGISLSTISCDKDNDDDDNYNNNTSPTASFTVSPSSGTISTTFSFDASTCSDNEDPASSLQVRWDWENDESWDVSYTTTKTASHQYSSDGTYIVKMEVKDLSGMTHSTTKSIMVGSGGNQTGTFTDSRDSKTYNWVKIGNQTWMEENLAYLPSVRPSSEESYTTPYYYVYGYQGTSVTAAIATSNYQTYGVLYNWPAAMNGASSSSSNPSGVQGVCPTGWHLPSDAEWKQLEMYLGMSQSEADYIGLRGTNEGSKLAGNASLWADGILENDSEFGTSGFTALPGGYRYYNGSFINIGVSGVWWSSTEYSSASTWRRYLYYNSWGVYRRNFSMADGFSVRCTGD